MTPERMTPERMTPEHIRDALRDCYDSTIALNVVDLGLVLSIALAPDAEAPGTGIPGVPQRSRTSIRLLSTSPDEAAQSQLRAQVHNRLAGLECLSHITVEIASEPLWTPARITPEGRRILGLDRPQFPILNNRVRPL